VDIKTLSALKKQLIRMELLRYRKEQERKSIKEKPVHTKIK
jgi:hypothetical protein